MLGMTGHVADGTAMHFNGFEDVRLNARTQFRLDFGALRAMLALGGKHGLAYAHAQLRPPSAAHAGRTAISEAE